MITEFHIGIDDTDSSLGGCTTYTATLAFEALYEKGFKALDFPWLVRLNPNIPWKTRGNGALAIHLLVSEDEIPEVSEIVLKIVNGTSDTSQSGTDPAVVFLKGAIPAALSDYYAEALNDILTVADARRVAKSVGSQVHMIRGNKGMIGSLAALGAGLEHSDHSFEIIAYRSKENLGRPRNVDGESVLKMNSEYGDRTFHNTDAETGRVLISPHGPDPVLLGIRGQSPEVVLAAFSRVEIREPVDRIMIFRTNQGTDAHIRIKRSISSLRAYQSTVVSGKVETVPRVLKGGHVLFHVGDGTGSLDCLAFEPTGSMARIARELLPGDNVKVSGGVRGRGQEPLSLNLEKIEIIQLTEAFRELNPKCPICRSRCESMGRMQGFRCKNCSFRLGLVARDRMVLRRKLEAPTTYIPPARSRRHLTRPDESQDQKIQNAIGDDYSLEVLLEAIRNPSLVAVNLPKAN